PHNLGPLLSPARSSSRTISCTLPADYLRGLPGTASGVHTPALCVCSFLLRLEITAALSELLVKISHLDGSHYRLHSFITIFETGPILCLFDTDRGDDSNSHLKTAFQCYLTNSPRHFHGDIVIMVGLTSYQASEADKRVEFPTSCKP